MNDANHPSTAPTRITPTHIAFIVVVIIAATMGWWFGHQSSGSAGQEATIQQHTSRMDALDNSTPDHGSMQGSMMSGALPRATGAGMQQGPLAHMLGMKSLEAIKADQLQKQHQLESSFAHDPADASAASVELGMLKTMTDPALMADGIAPGNPEVKCHRNSCRVSAVFNNSSDASGWAVNYLTLLAGKMTTGQPVFTAQPDGTVRMQLYGGRGK